MGGVQERWVEKIKGGVGLKEIYDVPCKELPGIKARFEIIEEGHITGFEPGIYLIVGIHPDGVSHYPAVRDAINDFVIRKLIDFNEEKSSVGRKYGQGVEFEIAGRQENTGATVLRLKPTLEEKYQNIGERVENGEFGMRVAPFENDEASS